MSWHRFILTWHVPATMVVMFAVCLRPCPATCMVVAFLLALIYMFYFYSLIAQFTGLVGAEGILPLTNNLDGLRRAISRTSGAHLWILRFVNWIWSQPSFQTNPSKVAEIGCSLSVFTAVLVYYDFRWLSAPCFVLLFLLYFSVKHVGRTWLNFQWDILVLESGFFAPLLLTQSVWALGIFQFLVVKVMWGSGICKITSGCPKWADGSAMEYHYWTTCLPAPLSYYFHYYTLKFAPWASRIQVWTTLFIQIVATVLATTTPFLKTIAFALDTLLMIAIGVTGNYGPFGLQTCALATSLLQFGDCGSWALMDAWDLETLPLVLLASSVLLLLLRLWPFCLDDYVQA
eukprot:GEMP01028197.1.p1 GENE.GEMP01028197.1~~GEMP01028197.1.p1  ORF type:complete len:345 (+),score=23.28 GEMP01028197.1:141-1175(+)